MRRRGWSGTHRQHVQDDVLDLNLIFEHGLQFEPSHNQGGLQLADLVAYVVRWAILQPADAQAQTAYNLIRPKLRRFDGTALALVRLSTARGTPDTRRYRHVYRA